MYYWYRNQNILQPTALICQSRMIQKGKRNWKHCEINKASFVFVTLRCRMASFLSLFLLLRWLRSRLVKKQNENILKRSSTKWDNFPLALKQATSLSRIWQNIRNGFRNSARDMETGSGFNSSSRLRTMC